VARRIQIAVESLIAMLSERNTEGMEILYDNYSSALYGVIHRIVQNEKIAEDVLQETFLKIWNNFKQYDPAKGRLFTWMVNVARNMAIDKVRSKEFSQNQKNRPLSDTVSFVDFDNQATYNPETIGLKEMVRKLEPEYRQIIDLLFFGGYTQSEAAEKLNIPLGTVKTRSRAAIMKLRMQFEKEKVN
jgi:RNA polymerase sigma-70 factor (ECF subfamily)